jgi:hypothetical protein
MEIKEEIPLDENGNLKLKFEVRMGLGKNGAVRQAVFINGQLLDWSVDITSLADAHKMGPEYFRAAKKDIEKHFVESVSEFIGRKITYQEVVTATKTGWI